MDATFRTLAWRQFGAAIDMLENAIHACPDELWGDRSQNPEYWYTVYHTLFFVDLYLSPQLEGFAPPLPFNLDEMDPAGILPPNVYGKDVLLSYLEHGRAKCKSTIATISDEDAAARCGFHWLEISRQELLLYNTRHVQHHAAQLNLILRQKIDSAPKWVAFTKH